MIYLDSSIALAHLFAEIRTVPDSFWREALVASRLTEYEVWNRIHTRQLMPLNVDSVRNLLGRLEMFELNRDILVRALAPFPVPVRTLDGLHLATIDYLRGRGEQIELASFDKRLLAGAQALGITLYAG